MESHYCQSTMSHITALPTNIKIKNRDFAKINTFLAAKGIFISLTMPCILWSSNNASNFAQSESEYVHRHLLDSLHHFSSISASNPTEKKTDTSRNVKQMNYEVAIVIYVLIRAQERYLCDLSRLWGVGRRCTHHIKNTLPAFRVYRRRVLRGLTFWNRHTTNVKNWTEKTPVFFHLRNIFFMWRSILMVQRKKNIELRGGRNLSKKTPIYYRRPMIKVDW